MGLFSSKRSDQKAEKWDKKASAASKDAREEARLVAKYRRSLASGKSDDPAADRYLIQNHDANRRVLEAVAGDCRSLATQIRKWRI